MALWHWKPITFDNSWSPFSLPCELPWNNLVTSLVLQIKGRWILAPEKYFVDPYQICLPKICNWILCVASHLHLWLFFLPIQLILAMQNRFSLQMCGHFYTVQVSSSKLTQWLNINETQKRSPNAQYASHRIPIQCNEMMEPKKTSPSPQTSFLICYNPFWSQHRPTLFFRP